MNGLRTTGPARYESLAEECTELAQAALKMARLIRGENPTPIKRGEAETNLQQEIENTFSIIDDENLTTDVSPVIHGGD